MNELKERILLTESIKQKYTRFNWVVVIDLLLLVPFFIIKPISIEGFWETLKELEQALTDSEVLLIMFEPILLIMIALSLDRLIWLAWTLVFGSMSAGMIVLGGKLFAYFTHSIFSVPNWDEVNVILILVKLSLHLYGGALGLLIFRDVLKIKRIRLFPFFQDKINHD